MPHPFADFYPGKRVLVTGHTGFTGGWLVAWLKLLGARVFGYGLPPTSRPNLFDANLLDRGITSMFGDVRDRNALANAFAEFQPEIVIHNAAQSLVQHSHRDPVETFATNVMGTVHVLEEARLTSSVRALVVASGDQCYENRDWFWGYREEDALGGQDPHSSSQACAELVTSTYIQSFFQGTKTAVATARVGNVIGGGDWTQDRLIPDIVRGITAGQRVVIRDGSAVLPLFHVLEAVRAHLLLAQRLFEGEAEYSGPWNFGPRDEDEISLRNFAESFTNHRGQGEGELILNHEDSDTHRPRPIRLNTTKAQTRLDWMPVLGLDEAIAWTVEWYRTFYADPASAWQTTENQIQQFMRSSTQRPAVTRTRSDQ
jgi:CDP-glucose 4,6-dehydratase